MAVPLTFLIRDIIGKDVVDGTADVAGGPDAMGASQ
jgi:hypothetical protein